MAIKIAPFSRYATLDVVRAVVDSGRDDIALYTGNDDAIVIDLLTPFRFLRGGRPVERRIVGGLLGHWAVWTRQAVALLDACRAAAATGVVPRELLAIAAEVTDANAAFFDAANGFAGCIAGLHEVLRRQGLLTTIRCLDPHETLSPGQTRRDRPRAGGVSASRRRRLRVGAPRGVAPTMMTRRLLSGLLVAVAIGGRLAGQPSRRPRISWSSTRRS